MERFSKATLFLLAKLLCACVIPYEIPLPNNARYLVVEANLNDVEPTQAIRINETNNFSGDIYNTPVKRLNVELIVSGSERISLHENQNGVYYLPEFFRIEPGRTYKLRFKKPDGTTYESTEEKTTPVPAIDRIFDNFEVKGLKGDLNDIPASYVFLDFQDNRNTTDYYVWTWKLWESQKFCRIDYYDYYCKTNCWEILNNKDINVFSDRFSNGKLVKSRLVAKIPYYSFDGALLEIKQLTVSEKAYKYFKLVSEQQQTNGTLVDTPPAAIIGNIRNLNNADEPVTGVFSVASMVVQKYWLSRENGIGKAAPIGLLGRKPNLSTFPLSYACEKGPTRTPEKPDGWLN